MPVWIYDAAGAPAVFIGHREDDCRAGCRGTRKGGVRVRHRQDHARRGAVQGRGAEVAIFRRFIAQPKFRARDGQPGPVTHSGAGRTKVDLEWILLGSRWCVAQRLSVFAFQFCPAGVEAFNLDLRRVECGMSLLKRFRR